MKVYDLLNELERFDPDAEVRLMSQPSWPFEYDLRGLVAASEIETEAEGDDGFYQYSTGYAPRDGYDGEVVYLLEGAQLCYGTKDAWPS